MNESKSSVEEVSIAKNLSMRLDAQVNQLKENVNSIVDHAQRLMGYQEEAREGKSELESSPHVLGALVEKVDTIEILNSRLYDVTKALHDAV